MRGSHNHTKRYVREVIRKSAPAPRLYDIQTGRGKRKAQKDGGIRGWLKEGFGQKTVIYRRQPSGCVKGREKRVAKRNEGHALEMGGGKNKDSENCVAEDSGKPKSRHRDCLRVRRVNFLPGERNATRKKNSHGFRQTLKKEPTKVGRIADLVSNLVIITCERATGTPYRLAQLTGDT